MFTGIITDIGEVAAIARHGDTRFTIRTNHDTTAIALGASIACSGCCLTAVAFGENTFDVDVSAESMARTTLGGR